MKTAAIAGAGLVGRLIALELLRQGWQVILCDKDAIHGTDAAGYAAAGMLAPYAEIETAESEIFDLGWRSIDLWPGILARLPRPVAWQQAGSLLLSHPQDQAECDRYLERVQRVLAGRAEITRLSKALSLALEPGLRAGAGNIYLLPGEGHLCTQDFFIATTQALQHEQVTWRCHTPVRAVEAQRVYLEDGEIECDIAFDCRGLGAVDAFAKLRGIRGELLWLHAPQVSLTRPIRLMHPRYRLYVVPRSDNIYLVGASEIESQDMSAISVRSSLELLSAAYSLDAGFAEARVVKTVVNCRPALPDNMPKVVVEDGLVRINGLYRHGYLLAPALVEKALEKVGMPFTHANAAIT